MDLYRLHDDLVSGASSDILVHPDHYQGIRTATGIEQQRMVSLAGMQRMEQGIRNSILDIMRFTIDPYAPKTIRRQFRFPRSKKKRIRKKWAKDPRNWREENVIWKISGSKLDMAMRNFTLPTVL